MARSEKQRKLAGKLRGKGKRSRGRPRRQNVERTESGAISRARESTGDAMTVALAYRQTQFGLTDEQAGHEKAATVIGRMWLRTKDIKDGDSRKLLTTSMREAAETFLGHYTAAMRAIKAPVGLAKGGAGGGSGDEVTKAYCDWVFGAIGEYEVHKAAMRDLGLSVWNIIDRVVIHDQECPMGRLADLKRGLQVLAERYGKVPRDKDAGKIVSWAASS